MKKALLISIMALCTAAIFAGEPGATANERSLLGRWRWISAEAVTMTVETGEASANYLLTFEADGTFKLKADCRQGSGTYVATDGVISMNLLSVTDTNCTAGSFADDMVDVLKGGSFKYTMPEATQLTLSFAAGAGTAEFLKVNDEL